MTERYTGIPENQKIARVVPEGGQAKAIGGASGRENTWQNPEASQTASADQRREQTGSARENIHNAYTDMQRRFGSSRKGTLAEIRDLLRQQEIRRELDEMAAFRTGLDEKLNRKREETLSGSQEGGEKITVGKLLLSLLAGLLSAPAELAEQTAKDSKRQAEQAA